MCKYNIALSRQLYFVNHQVFFFENQVFNKCAWGIQISMKIPDSDATLGI